MQWWFALPLVVHGWSCVPFLLPCGAVFLSWGGAAFSAQLLDGAVFLSLSLVGGSAFSSSSFCPVLPSFSSVGWCSRFPSFQQKKKKLEMKLHDIMYLNQIRSNSPTFKISSPFSLWVMLHSSLSRCGPCCLAWPSVPILLCVPSPCGWCCFPHIFLLCGVVFLRPPWGAAVHPFFERKI